MATWIVGGALLLLVGGIVFSMFRDKRLGKHACCGDCSRCAGRCGLH